MSCWEIQRLKNSTEVISLKLDGSTDFLHTIEIETNFLYKGPVKREPWHSLMSLFIWLLPIGAIVNTAFRMAVHLTSTILCHFK